MEPGLPIFIVVIVAVMIFRFRKILSGGRVHRNRIISSTAMLIAFSFLAVFGSFQEGVSADYVFVYVGLLAGSAYLSNRFVGRSLVMWNAEDGFVHARGGIFPYVVWLVGFVTRFILGYLFLGANLPGFYGTKTTLSASDVEIVLIVDLIMMIGAGAVTGRNVRILSKLKNFQTGNEKSNVTKSG
ncbi:MAG: hypothetical protein KGH88_06200 [Thaumarchaeota archaeon]|nr:hypothetical protein [Nitrososphaerota archaeon]